MTNAYTELRLNLLFLINIVITVKGFELVNKAFFYSFQDKYNDLQRKFNWVMRQVELYDSFLFFKAR